MKNSWFTIVYSIIMMPHLTYLAFEVKHLIQKDGVAEERDLESILAFGGMGVIGLVGQVVFIVLCVNFIEDFARIKYLGIIALSFLAAFGGCLGLADYAWLMILSPYHLLKGIFEVLTNKVLVRVCLGTTLLLTFLSMPFV